jgi:hypothetical protein
MLYRAADALQEIFYIYREHTFELDLEKIEVVEFDELRLLERERGKREKTPEAWDLIHPFPEVLVSCDIDKKAVLTYDAGEYAMA